MPSNGKDDRRKFVVIAGSGTTGERGDAYPGLLRRLFPKNGLRFSGVCDHVFHLFAASFAKHFVALQGRKDVCAAINSADRIDDLGRDPGYFSLSGIERRHTNIFCAGHSASGRGFLDQLPLGA